MPKKSDAPGAPYTVGYRRPPAHTRFRPGQSGNPRGRPRKTAPPLELPAGLDRLSAATLRILAEEVSVCLDGRVGRVSGEEAILLAQRERALQGDMRSARFLLEQREKAQALAVQARARSKETQGLSRPLSALVGAMYTANLLGYENVEAYLDQARQSRPHSPAEPDVRYCTEPARVDDEPSTRSDIQSERVNPPCDAGTQEQEVSCYRGDLPHSERSEGSAEVGAKPAPPSTSSPQPPLTTVSKSGPPIRSGDTWSGHGYGVGGAARRPPDKGIFK